MSQYTRDDRFSYTCRACSRCCHHKRIQVNPYEIARLARNLGISPHDLIEEHLEPGAPYLRTRDDGACVFLGATGCGVHRDRPLVCRLYPLGRHVAADGAEYFHELQPEPQTEGVYGKDDTVSTFLAQQEAFPFMAAADRYQALFYRIFDALQAAFASAAIAPGDAQRVMQEALPIAGWLDAEAFVAPYCAKRGLRVPIDPEEMTNLHIAAIDEWLNEKGNRQ